MSSYLSLLLTLSMYTTTNARHDKGCRQTNLDVLRLLSMLGVVINHFYNSALLIYSPGAEGFCMDLGGACGATAWFLLEAIKLLALVSVNCFVLISGYFLIENQCFRGRAIWNVWSQTLFYSVGVWIVLAMAGVVPFRLVDAARYFLPVCNNTYWFITNYLALMLVAPFVSTLAGCLDKRSYRYLLIVGAVLVLQYPFGRLLVDSQQFLLFVYLYIVGGYLRLYPPRITLRMSTALAAVVLAAMLAIAVAKNVMAGDGCFRIISMEYNGLVLPLSMFVFMLFCHWSVPACLRRPIAWLSPLALSVYLLHEHPLVSGIMWGKVRDVVASHQEWQLPADVLAGSILIFLACVLVDGVRHAVARRLPWTRRVIPR